MAQILQFPCSSRRPTHGTCLAEAAKPLKGWKPGGYSLWWSRGIAPIMICQKLCAFVSFFRKKTPRKWTDRWYEVVLPVHHITRTGFRHPCFLCECSPYHGQAQRNDAKEELITLIYLWRKPDLENMIYLNVTAASVPSACRLVFFLFAMEKTTLLSNTSRVHTTVPGLV
jgi:hypothetical protein